MEHEGTSTGFLGLVFIIAGAVCIGVEYGSRTGLGVGFLCYGVVGGIEGCLKTIRGIIVSESRTHRQKV